MPGYRPRRDPLLRLASGMGRRAAVAAGSVGVSGVARTADTSTGGGSTTAIVGELHCIDTFSVTDDSNDEFTLSFSPVSDSWNPTVNGVMLEEGVDYNMVGDTLTVLDPADLFLEADTQGTPWQLRVQYDYLVGMPSRVAPQITSVRYREVAKGDATSFWPSAYDDSAWTHAPTPDLSFGAGAYTVVYAWDPANDIQVRATVAAPAGQDLSFEVHHDDGAATYWNGVLVDLTSSSANQTWTIAGADVLASNVLAIRAFDTNPVANRLVVDNLA